MVDLVIVWWAGLILCHGAVYLETLAELFNDNWVVQRWLVCGGRLEVIEV